MAMAYMGAQGVTFITERLQRLVFFRRLLQVVVEGKVSRLHRRSHPVYHPASVNNSSKEMLCPPDGLIGGGELPAAASDK